MEENDFIIINTMEKKYLPWEDYLSHKPLIEFNRVLLRQDQSCPFCRHHINTVSSRWDGFKQRFKEKIYLTRQWIKNKAWRKTRAYKWYLCFVFRPKFVGNKTGYWPFREKGNDRFLMGYIFPSERRFEIQEWDFDKWEYKIVFSGKAKTIWGLKRKIARFIFERLYDYFYR